MPPDNNDSFDPGIDSDLQPGTVEVGGVQVDDPARTRERLADDTPFEAGDVQFRDGSARVREGALRREAADRTPFPESAFSVEGGEVEAPDPTERVDVSVFDDDVSGDVELVGPGGRRRDLGADAGGDDPFFGRIDAPDRQGRFEVQIGGETVESFRVGAAGAAIDRPGDLDRGFTGTVLDADRGDVGVTQQAVEDEPGDEGLGPLDRVNDRDGGGGDRDLQTFTFESGPEFRAFEPGDRTGGDGGDPLPPLDTPTIDQTDVSRGEPANPGETRAAVNRFGQQQLEATDPSEQFGDVVVESPFSDGRLEDDLNQAGDAIADGVDTGVGGISRGAVPATSAPGNLVRNARIVEQAGFRAAEAGGFVSDTPEEGPLETAAEAGVSNAVDTFNPPRAAAEAKEIGEFVATQPGRIAGDAATAATDRRDDSILPGLVGDAQDTGERAASTEFSQDVEQRAGRVGRTAAESVAERPVETGAGAVGGLAAGAAVGAGLGRAAARVPGVSGSDLSGRALQGVGRAARDVRDFAGDSRAQGQIPGGRSRGGGDGGDGLPDELAAELERFESATRIRQAEQRAADRVEQRQDELEPDEPRSVSSRDFRTASAAPDTSRSGPTQTQTEAFRSSLIGDDAADSPLDDVTEPSATAADGDRDFTGSRFAAGLVAAPLARIESAQSLSVEGSTSVFGEGIGATTPTVDADADGALDTVTRLGGDSDTRLDNGFATRFGEGFGSRFDSRVDSRQDSRLDSRQDTRTDTRQDTRVDTRQDTRTDTRQDTRVDSRFDQRVDTRFDTRFDSRFDTRTDGDPDPERDDRREAVRFDGLFAERTFDSGIADAETAGDILFGDGGGGGDRGATDTSADRVERFGDGDDLERLV